MKHVLALIGGELLVGNLVATVMGHGMGGGAWASINLCGILVLIGAFALHIIDQLNK